MSLKRLKSALSLPTGKTLWIIIGGVIAAFLVGLYIFLSIQAWSNLSKRSESQYSAVKNDLAETLRMNTATESEKAKKMKALKAAAIVIDKQAIDCGVSPLLAWQQLVWGNAEKIKQCQAITDKLQKTKSSLNAVIAHIESEQELSRLIVAVAIQQVGEADWPKLAKQWSDVAAAVSKKSVAKSFKPTQDLAKKQTEAISTAWQGLIAANTAKDRVKYEAAVAAIATAYKGLSDLPQTSATGLQLLITEFELVYSKTFLNT